MLNERTIRVQKPRASTWILWDVRLKGLGCRITPAGSQAFVLRYTDTKGKQRLATLARVGAVPLREIRKQAGRELLKMRMGETDLLSRRQQRRGLSAPCPDSHDSWPQWYGGPLWQGLALFWRPDWKTKQLGGIRNPAANTASSIMMGMLADTAGNRT